jgi:hypothetical protein
MDPSLMRYNRAAPRMCLALLGIALSGCRADTKEAAFHNDVAADSVVAHVTLPESARTWIDSVRAGEAKRIDVSAGAVTRATWNVLVVRAQDGRQQQFTDVVSGDGVMRLHVYRGYLASIAQHLIEVIDVPEGGTFVMVDGRAGNRWEVDGPPVPSPDGSRIVTASLDLVAGHRPNRIRIYRLEPGRLVIEWETSPRDWGGTAPLWLDSGAIRVDRAMIDSTTTPFTVRTSPMRIERDSGSWRIVPG